MSGRPKTIYYYEQKRLEKHQVTSECMVEVVSQMHLGTRFPIVATRFRCRAHGHDVYGFGKMKEAKEFEIQETKHRISDERVWLDKLSKDDEIPQEIPTRDERIV